MQETKDFYKEAGDVYAFIIGVAGRCERLISEKKATEQNKKAIDIYEYACYRALKSEIQNWQINSKLFEASYVTCRRLGISAIKILFDDCTISQRKNKKAEKQDKIMRMKI